MSAHARAASWAVLIYVVGYLLTAFVQASLNPFAWETKVRLTLAILATSGAGFATLTTFAFAQDQ